MNTCLVVDLNAGVTVVVKDTAAVRGVSVAAASLSVTVTCQSLKVRFAQTPAASCCAAKKTSARAFMTPQPQPTRLSNDRDREKSLAIGLHH